MCSGVNPSETTPLANAARQNRVMHITVGDKTDFKLDGQLDDPVWKNSKPVMLENLISQGDQPAKNTQAYAAVIDNKIILAFRADEPNFDKLKADIDRRDGQLWKNDSIDIVL